MFAKKQTSRQKECDAYSVCHGVFSFNSVDEEQAILGSGKFSGGGTTKGEQFFISAFFSAKKACPQTIYG